MSDKSNSEYLKSGLWYTIGNVLIKGISFLTLPLFTRLLSPEDFGMYNIFLSYENILNVIIGLGISGTIKVAYFDYNNRFNEYFSSVTSLTCISAVVLDIIANVVLYVLGHNDNPMWNYGLINLLIFSSLATAVYNLLSVKFVIEIKYKTNLGISFFYTISNILISLIMCLSIYSTQRYLGRIVGQTMPLLFISVIFSLYYFIKYKNVLNFEYWAYAIKLGLPLILHMLSMVLMLQVGKLMIDYHLGSTYTGIYSVAATLSALVSLLLSCFDNAWAPWFYRGLAGNKDIELKSGNNKLSVLFAIFMSIILLGVPEILKIMTTSDYYDAIYSIVPLMIAVFANFMYLFAVNQEYYYKKTKTIAVGTVIATLVGFVLDYLYIPVWGYITAAYVDLICKIILYAIHTIYIRRIHVKDVVNHTLLILLLLFTSIIGAVTIALKDFIWGRYIIVFLLCIYCYKPLAIIYKKMTVK